jgi:hypothetical protein
MEAPCAPMTGVRLSADAETGQFDEIRAASYAFSRASSPAIEADTASNDGAAPKIITDIAR